MTLLPLDDDGGGGGPMGCRVPEDEVGGTGVGGILDPDVDGALEVKLTGPKSSLNKSLMPRLLTWITCCCC